MFLFFCYIFVGLILGLRGLGWVYRGHRGRRFMLISVLFWLPALALGLVLVLYQKVRGWVLPEDPLNPEDYGC